MNELETDNKNLTFWAPNFSKQKKYSTLILDKKMKKSMFFQWKSTIPDSNCSTPYYNKDQKLNRKTSDTFQHFKKN